MKKFMLAWVCCLVLVLIAAGCKSEKNSPEDVGNTPIASSPAVDSDTPDENNEQIPVISLSIRKIVDNSNVIVRFHTEPAGEKFFGATDAPNYKVTDASGMEQSIVSVESAFVELGSDEEALDTFHIVFKSPLAPGEYKVEVSNQLDIAARTMAPSSTTFTIEGEASAVESSEQSPAASPKETVKETPKATTKETPKETPKATTKETPKETPKATTKETPKETPKATPKEALKDKSTTAPAPSAEPAAEAAEKSGLKVTIKQVVDNSNVIVKFSMNDGFFGATDAPNYVVKDQSGKVQEIASVASAFVELGGDEGALGTFKITFKSALAQGKYTVTTMNMVDSPAEPSNKFAPSTATFTIQ